MVTKRDSKYYKEIGRLGGAARILKHGNPGTKEGRSKGGKVAISRMKNAHRDGGGSGFVVAKEIVPIRRSVFLAEFIGVLFGDGHVGKYQTSITLDSKTDREYAEYLKKEIERHFKVKVSMRFRKSTRALDLVISSVYFSRQMVHFGAVEGNKLQGNFRTPQWIRNSIVYSEAFIRGLFDTDGTVYLEVKKVKDKEYKYIGAAITSASPTLLEDVTGIFREIGFSPTWTSRQKSVFLRRQNDVRVYFLRVASHNSKHSVRYQMFLKEKCESG